MKVCEVLPLAALLITSSMELVKGRELQLILSFCCNLNNLGLVSCTGVVEISPSEIAPICQAGDQRKLTCSTSGVLQTWKFTAISESGAAMTFTRTVSSGGSTGVDSQPLIINSTLMFTFSRLSCQGSLPLISRMTIDPVTEGLNGTRVNCLDGITSESATTTLHIIGGTRTIE